MVELRKGYTAAEVFNRFRRVGRANGYEMLELVGGALFDIVLCTFINYHSFS